MYGQWLSDCWVIEWLNDWASWNGFIYCRMFAPNSSRGLPLQLKQWGSNSRTEQTICLYCFPPSSWSTIRTQAACGDTDPTTVTVQTIDSPVSSGTEDARVSEQWLNNLIITKSNSLLIHLYLWVRVWLNNVWKGGLRPKHHTKSLGDRNPACSAALFLFHFRQNKASKWPKSFHLF